ncbi:MAG: hypothetical protein ACXQS8_01540 [Candidatus Helarchaeales archaeon]
MRLDPTSRETYNKAISLIEKTLNRELKKVELYNLTKSEVKDILEIDDEFLDLYKGFYMHDKNIIFIVDGNEEDFQTFIHEALHSNSIFHSDNSPIWIFEGLTKAIT